MKPPKTMPVVEMVVNGKKVRGVILDETHGRPVGTIAIISDDVRYVQKAGGPKVCVCFLS